MSDLFFGTAGWSFADWTGPFYPKVARGEHLRYYSEYFDCAEVNTTFYRPPEAKLSAGWVKQVEGRRFVFPVKVSQEFTHEGTWGKAEAGRFLEGIAPIAEAGRLGPLLVQFPWSFRNVPVAQDQVARIAEWFGGRDVVVEVRHASWDKTEVRDWLRALGLSLASIDQPALPDCLAPAAHVTGPVGYVRLHGRRTDTWFKKDTQPYERYDYLYGEAELDPWVERVREMMAKAKAAYVIGNNHYRGKAPANTLQMRARLTGRKVRVPDALQAAFPLLREIAEPESGRLF
jgi:uncharacterized protein YecE (DUF72 family)